MTGFQPTVAYLTSSVSRRGGGVYHCLTEQTNAMAESGAAAVQIHGIEDEWTMADRASWRDVLVNTVPIRGPRVLGYAPGLLYALCASGADVLHLHGLWQFPSAAALLWHRRTHKPVIISPHGMLDQWALRNAAWKKRIARLLYEDANLRSAACLHALNRAEAASLRALGLRNPIAVIPNGVALPARLAGEQRVASTSDHRSILLYLGRLHPKKGLVELVRAWAWLKAQSIGIARQWLLVIAGWDDGGHADSVRREIAAHSLDGDIRVTGPVYGAEKTALLGRASAFVLPSRSEGLPMAVLEAWSHELPVFMTAACNLPDGFAARAAVEIAHDAATTAATLAAHLGDPNLSDFGRRGLALVKDRYAWPAIAATYADLYRWLARGSDAPSCVSFT